MKPASFCCTLCLSLSMGLACASAQAQLYKWVDDKGKTHYTDTPPPTSAKASEKKAVQNSEGGGNGFPFELARVVQAQPVTLFTTANCPACDQGRALLTQRGVPFTEKTVSTTDDIAQLRLAGGSSQLPFLVVGRASQQGIEDGIWNTLLSTAGYPETSKLPKSYRNAAAVPAAAPLKPAAADAGATAAADANGSGNAASRAPDSLPPAIGNVPPGFRF